MPSCLALFAHPDDLEFVAAGTLLLLGRMGWDLHVMHLCRGDCGSVRMDAAATAAKRLEEAREGALLIGARHPPPSPPTWNSSTRFPNCARWRRWSARPGPTWC